MTDDEYDVLDELYFVQSFSALSEKLQMSEKDLKQVLKSLFEKGWIKCFEKMPEELVTESPDFQDEYRNYHYLATKAGLLIHNSR